MFRQLTQSLKHCCAAFMPCFALWLKQSAHNGEQFLIECFPTKQKNKMEVSEKKKSGFDWSSFLSRPHTELLPKVGDWRSICVFTELRSSLFNLGGWIVSINNCCRLISQSHKDQAAGIYGARLDVGVCHLCGVHARAHTHTRNQVVTSLLWSSSLACRPSVSAAVVQVFIWC